MCVLFLPPGKYRAWCAFSLVKPPEACFLSCISSVPSISSISSIHTYERGLIIARIPDLLIWHGGARKTKCLLQYWMVAATCPLHWRWRVYRDAAYSSECKAHVFHCYPLFPETPLPLLQADATSAAGRRPPLPLPLPLLLLLLIPFRLCPSCSPPCQPGRSSRISTRNRRRPSRKTTPDRWRWPGPSTTR